VSMPSPSRGRNTGSVRLVEWIVFGW
jgi:hypothetical protein